VYKLALSHIHMLIQPQVPNVFLAIENVKLVSTEQQPLNNVQRAIPDTTYTSLIKAVLRNVQMSFSKIYQTIFVMLVQLDVKDVH
jgi:hypothetical protein